MAHNPNEYWHRRLLEHRSGLFAIFTTVAVSIGGLVEIVPLFTVGDGRIMDDTALAQPYTPLEVAGRDIYIREGCMVCHSQMVRPFRDETLRYGPWSHAEEYRYDRPFLLGSRRIGPDLHRVGGKYPNSWHYEHMMDPRDLNPTSIMPAYQWLADWEIDVADVTASVRALKAVGTPYSDEEVAGVEAQLQAQGGEIAADLATAGIETAWNKEIVALTAYLQRLGKNTTGPVARGEGGAE
jgi:cytochrome c oxidase cbb3-type subunit I/II